MDPGRVQGQARSRVEPSLVYICDWLPPDFGAVGQYSLMFARAHAAEGRDVLLAGLSSTRNSLEREATEKGRLRILRLRASPYDRSNFLVRSWWTLKTNLRIIWALRKELHRADEIKFTGSPPFMLHVLAPLNRWFLRKKLTYRITDFHPESLIATLEHVPAPLQWFQRLTLFWRRRVDKFEVLGEDQKQLLLSMGIPAKKILLKRDPSPVTITAETQPLERPTELGSRCLLLYSGNFGVAHDYETFVEAYARHHERGSGRVGLWLNAVGARADRVEQELRNRNLPVHRSRPVPLEDLPNLLVTPDAHLITLLDPFVGLVMPSKVYGCIESRLPVLYVGSERSDVHRLCAAALEDTMYWQVNVGNVERLSTALDQLANARPRHN